MNEKQMINAAKLLSRRLYIIVGFLCGLSGFAVSKEIPARTQRCKGRTRNANAIYLKGEA